ncbi:hypothetical protein BRD11_02595 [Halobacteriales archaeon SW_12_69_24]|nr:MAG: hypothetical protein BRD11_02595 [Halobacteriales archaeon SW_12_69_24]
MDRRYLAGVVVALVAIGVVAVVVSPLGPSVRSPSGTAETYPAGAGPEHINFTTLPVDGANVSHTPREYWDSYAIVYSEPMDRRRIEGDYYIDATTGAVLGDRWRDARVYRNGSTYAFVHPADTIPENEREEYEDDPEFVYHEATDAYYRYDSQYLSGLETTNIGTHPTIAESYTWTALERTTHHGVPVITYRVTGTRSEDSRAPTPENGTLQLGAEDGIVYAYELVLTDDGETFRRTYEVRPAPFPDHEWVETARAVAGENDTAEDGS